MNIKQEEEQLNKLLIRMKQLQDSRSKGDCNDDVAKELASVKIRVAWHEERIMGIKRQAQQIREQSNLGLRFSVRTFDTYNLEHGDFNAYKECNEYADALLNNTFNERNSIILTGKVGCGKTHLAASIANKCIDNGIPTIFSTFSDILKKERLRIKEHSQKSFIEDCASIPLLVIDDLGKEKVTEWSSEILFQIINHRYEDMLPTIITTNMGFEELGQNLDEAIFSRLYEMSNFIKVMGVDRRIVK